jgi:phospholipase/carboxylesterase
MDGKRDSPLSRRRLLGIGAVGIAAAVSAACTAERIQEIARVVGDRQRERGRRTAGEGRLLARPGQPAGEAPLGLQPLGLDTARDGLLYVPAGYQPDRPAPLVLMLHGAGGNARHGLDPLLDRADEVGLILLAPDSRRQTWDVLLGDYGPDVAFIDGALAQTFGRYAVDPAHVAVEGFSDGASYALSLGITNGDLFTHVMAFSPGFAAPGGQRGAPRLFISHGIHDEVLPIDACSRRIVPLVQRAGYDVRYREFDGPHTVPPEIVGEALVWFAEGRG